MLARAAGGPGEPHPLESVSLYLMMVMWGLAVWASWIGWGTLVAQAAQLRRARIDWGLRAAWGMALTLAAGGALMMLHLANALALQILVLGGLGVWLAKLLQDGRRMFAARGRRLVRGGRSWWWYVLLAAVPALSYLGSIETLTFNWWDDLPAYLAFDDKILATGTLVDPFSWRRLSTYGGQHVLQAQVMSAGSDVNVNILERGLAPILFLGLLAGLLGRHGKQRWILAGMGILAVWVEVPRVNIQSQLTGAVLFLALYRTLRLYRRGDPRGAQAPWVAGMLAAALATLRMNFAPVGALALILAFGGAAGTDRRYWRRHALAGAVALAVMAAVLAPWAAVLHESSGSLFYPLMRGNQRPEFGRVLAAPLSLAGKIQWMGGFLVHPRVLLLIAPVLLVLRRRYWRAGLALYLAAIAGALATAWAFTKSDYPSLYRYSFPMLFPTCLVALAVALRRWRERRGVVAAGLAALILLGVNLVPGAALRQHDAAEAYASITAFRILAPAPLQDEYRAAQKAIPPGARVLSWTTFASLLDYKRNDVWTADYAGVASPDPGLPLHEGPEAFRRYLRSQGIGYIIASNFDRTLGIYERQRDRQARGGSGQAPTASATDMILVTPLRASMDLVDALATPERLEFAGPDIRVIRIDR